MRVVIGLCLLLVLAGCLQARPQPTDPQAPSTEGTAAGQTPGKDPGSGEPQPHGTASTTSGTDGAAAASKSAASTTSETECTGGTYSWTLDGKVQPACGEDLFYNNKSGSHTALKAFGRIRQTNVTFPLGSVALAGDLRDVAVEASHASVTGNLGHVYLKAGTASIGAGTDWTHATSVVVREGKQDLHQTLDNVIASSHDRIEASGLQSERAYFGVFDQPAFTPVCTTPDIEEPGPPYNGCDDLDDTHTREDEACGTLDISSSTIRDLGIELKCDAGQQFTAHALTSHAVSIQGQDGGISIDGSTIEDLALHVFNADVSLDGTLTSFSLEARDGALDLVLDPVASGSGTIEMREGTVSIATYPAIHNPGLDILVVGGSLNVHGPHILEDGESSNAHHAKSVDYDARPIKVPITVTCKGCHVTVEFPADSDAGDE